MSVREAVPKKLKTKKFYRWEEKCPQSDLWAHFCMEKGKITNIPLSKSETFPPCQTCGSVRRILKDRRLNSAFELLTPEADIFVERRLSKLLIIKARAN